MTSTAAEGPAARAGEDRRIIVMIGAPGAGKGTQAERLARVLDLPHVSTGKLFRAAVSSEQPLGAQVRSYVESGSLVPDDVAVEVVEQRLQESDAEGGAILDGFPRTRAQAVALDGLLARSGAAVTAALYVEVGIDVLMERMTGRRICSVDDQHVYHVSARPPREAGVCDIDGAELRQRNDDRPETVKRRLDGQLPPMFEVVDHYSEGSVLCAIRGDQPADAVTEELLRALTTSSRGS